MWVKICANTNLQDAALAAQLGADAVGFIFAPSKRQVTVKQVAKIAAELPAGLDMVGVFANAALSEIVEAVEVAGLTGVQLHGPLDADLISDLHDAFARRVKLIQVVPFETSATKDAESVFVQAFRSAVLQPHLWAILLDASQAGVSGGLGVAFDWKQAATAMDAILRGADDAPRVIVAGGLTPENVGLAIASLQPFGVDVASGVEAAPGLKDPEKLRRFTQGARRKIAR